MEFINYEQNPLNEYLDYFGIEEDFVELVSYDDSNKNNLPGELNFSDVDNDNDDDLDAFKNKLIKNFLLSKFDDGGDNDNDSSIQINYVPLLQLALLILVNPFIILLAITIIIIFIRDDFYDEYISLNNDIDLKLNELTNVNDIEVGYLTQTSKGNINENITKFIKFNNELTNELKGN